MTIVSPETLEEEPLVKEAILKLCVWLNEANRRQDPTWDTTYKLSDFTQPHLLPRILIDAQNDEAGTRLIQLWVSDGDEGGPGTLTLIIELDDNPPEDTPSQLLRSIIFEFDTYHTLIWDYSQSPQFLFH